MKKLIAILLSLIMVLSLAACGGSETPATDAPAADTPAADAPTADAPAAKAKIGALLPSLSFDFQLQMNNGIQRAADEFGYEYMAYDYNFDNELMLSGLDTMVASDVKGMYAIFLSGEVATPFMQEHTDIGVLTQGAMVEGAQACTVNDYVMLGEQFVEAMDKYVTENNITSGEIGALWLETCEIEDNEYYAAKEDIKAVINKWCEGKDFTFTAEFYPPDEETAANNTAQILNANPNLKFLFCFNNGYAIAAANEISASVPDVSGYFVFSSEGDAESFRLIESGTSPYRACAFADIEESGYQVGLQLINWVENGVLDDVVVTKVLVDSSNVAEFVE